VTAVLAIYRFGGRPRPKGLLRQNLPSLRFLEMTVAISCHQTGRDSSTRTTAFRRQ